MDNDPTERASRAVALGRRKWHVGGGADEGGRRAAQIDGILATCKSAGVKLHAYLADVLPPGCSARRRSSWPTSRCADGPRPESERADARPIASLVSRARAARRVLGWTVPDVALPRPEPGSLRRAAGVGAPLRPS